MDETTRVNRGSHVQRLLDREGPDGLRRLFVKRDRHLDAGELLVPCQNRHGSCAIIDGGPCLAEAHERLEHL